MRDLLWALLMINSLYISYASLEVEIDERQNRIGFVNGDFIIGALFSIHETPQSYFGNAIRCGKLRDQYGMQRVEAALWTISKINREKKILPNYTLGIQIRDTCWNSKLALRQSLQFIDFCPSTSNKLNKTSIVGVIGPPSSEETVPVQSLLQIFRIPQVGFSATTAKLSDRAKYEYFVRVVPSDTYQAKVMISILQKFNWTYVNAVSTDGLYGGNGMYEFKSLAIKHGICLHEFITVKPNTSDGFDTILSTFRKSDKARVIICFCEGETVRGLLMAAKRANESQKYIFIGSDGWAGINDIVKDMNEEAEGNLMIQVNSPHVPNFKEHYLNLSKRVNNSIENPWIEDFFNERFNCTLKKKPHFRPCTGNEWRSTDYAEDPKLSFVIRSIYVFAYALSKFTREICEKNSSISCKQFLNSNELFMNDYIRKVNVTIDNEIIQFDENGSAIARYEILNYQHFNGSYQYRKVGSWFNDRLELDVDAIQLPGNVPFIKSVCSEPCAPGQEKKKNDTSVPCCWECSNCSKKKYSTSNGEECTKCPNGTKPNKNQSGCVGLIIEYTVWWQTEILVCIFISAIGISISLLSALVFYKFYQTPMVRFSSRELSYIMYCGMILAYSSTFLILATPTKLRCALVRFIPGLSLTMIYGPLLVKTNRISRIFSMSKKRFPKLRPKYLSIKFQILACLVLIVTEIIICAIHNMKYYQSSVEQIMQPDKIILRCQSSSHEITVPHLLNVILLGFCTLYAFKTRNLPDNFNEAKFIAFSCYATAITWSAFLLIYYGSSLQTVSLSLVLTTSSLIIQMCLFAPKLYIILLRPEKNQRSNFITAKGMRIHVGSIDSTFAKEHCIRRKNEADSFSSIDDKNSKKATANYNSQDDIPDNLLKK